MSTTIGYRNTLAASVPETAAQLLLRTAEERHAAQASTVTVGSTLEVDLFTLGRLAPGLDDRLALYWASTRELWSRLDGGEEVDGVLVEVPLIRARQTDTAKSRADLRAELEAIERLSPLEPFRDLLEKDPDREALAARFTRFEHDGDRMVAALRLRHGIWPLCLGGPPRPGELARSVTVETGHAAWRDRKVRRLCAVSVDASEVWPDPAGF